MLKYAAKVLLILLLFPVSGWATDYYVAPSVAGSGDCSTAGNACTLATANAAVNGTGSDMVIMTAGTYTTGIVPATSGASDSPITYTVAAGATVTITAYRAIDLRNGQDYITIQKGDGVALILSASYTDLEAEGSDHCTLDGVTQGTVPSSAYHRQFQFKKCDYWILKNNSFEWDYTGDRFADNMMLFACERWEIGPNNTFGDCPHGVIASTDDCNYIRVHNNTFNNRWRAGLAIGCQYALDGEASDPSFSWIVENNLFDRVGILANENPNLADQGRSAASIHLSGSNHIIRNNTFYKGDIGITFYAYSPAMPYQQYIQLYHNTFYKNQDYGSLVDTAAEGTPLQSSAYKVPIRYNRFLNNIFYDPLGRQILTFASADGIPKLTGNTFKKNIFYNDTKSFRMAYDGVYYSLSAIEGVSSTGFSNNKTTNPLFVDPENLDFTLGTGSPGLADGEFLATIQTGGINTETDVITVGSNEGYAFAPSDWNIPNFSGDIIYAQDGASARVVSRTANTITVDDASVFTAGDTLTVIEFSGAAPNIGVGISSVSPPGESPIYTGWYNTIGTPTTIPASLSSTTADRTFLRKETATSNGIAYSLRIYVGNVWQANYAWVVAYKMVGTTLELIGYAPITSPTLNSWTDEIVLLEPTSEDMTFSTGDDIYYGVQFDPSGTVSIGRNLTGGSGLHYSTKTISGAVIEELLNTDMVDSEYYTTYDMAYVLGYAIAEDTDDPTVTITSPTSDATYNSPAGERTIDLSGTCSDASSYVTSITWADNHGNSGSGTIVDPWTSWTINNAVLAAGSTEITVTATDSYDNTNTDTITVTFVGPDATLIGWDNADNPPDDAITESSLVTADRIYTGAPWTATEDGEIKGLFWYVGTTWTPTNAWVVAYKVSGTDYIVIAQEVITGVALNSYNYVPFHSAVSGQSLRFSTDDQILYGIAADAGSGFIYGRNNSGGSNLLYTTTKDLSSGPMDLDSTTDITINEGWAPGFTLVYDDLPGDVTAPSVAITTPSSALTLLSNHYTIAGTASDETELSSVSWYCEESDSADGLSVSDGDWSTFFILAPGDNTITVRAVDATGNVSTDTVVITYTHNVFGGSCSGSF